jgi:hypothetical protein
MPEFAESPSAGCPAYHLCRTAESMGASMYDVDLGEVPGGGGVTGCAVVKAPRAATQDNRQRCRMSLGCGHGVGEDVLEERPGRDRSSARVSVPAQATLQSGESAERGEAARRTTPHAAHGDWSPAPDRHDQITVLAA